MEKFSFLFALSGVFIACCAQLLMKKTAGEKHASSFLRKFLNAKIIFAYSLMVLSSLINVICLRYMELKYVPLVEASGFLWIPLFSVLFLHEKPSSKTLLGAGIIILGMTCFGLGTL